MDASRIVWRCAAALGLAAARLGAQSQEDISQKHWCDQARRMEYCDNFRVTEFTVGMRVRADRDALVSPGIAIWEFGALHNWYYPTSGYQATGASVFAQMSDYTTGVGAHLRQRWWLRTETSIDMSLGYLMGQERLSPLWSPGLSFVLGVNHKANAITGSFVWGKSRTSDSVKPRAYLGGRWGGQLGRQMSVVGALAAAIGCLAVCGEPHH